jgi:hypothetical protein
MAQSQRIRTGLEPADLEGAVRAEFALSAGIAGELFVVRPFAKGNDALVSDRAAIQISDLAMQRGAAAQAKIGQAAGRGDPREGVSRGAEPLFAERQGQRQVRDLDIDAILAFGIALGPIPDVAVDFDSWAWISVGVEYAAAEDPARNQPAVDGVARTVAEWRLRGGACLASSCGLRSGLGSGLGSTSRVPSNSAGLAYQSMGTSSGR